MDTRWSLDRSRWRRRLALSCLAGLVCLGSQAGDDPFEGTPRCLGDGLEAPTASRLVEDALAILRHCGVDPEAYRLELRLEDPAAPDFPDPSAGRITGVLLWPRDASTSPALRIGGDTPCVPTWVWRPERFTARQRSILEQADQAAAASGGRAGIERSAVRVAQCNGRVGVRYEGTDGETAFRWSAELPAGPGESPDPGR